MYVIATFQQSIYIELAVTELQQKGISKEKILAVPIDKRTKPRKVFDTIHRADGFGMMDAAAVLATVFMLLGSIYGYELKWGPILWGIIGAVSGALLGFVLKWIVLKKRNFGTKNVTSEVVLIVRCSDSDWQTVEDILWANTALGVSKFKAVG